MSKNSEHHDTYIIPPNFIEGSTLFGGMFKIRNVIEAGVLAAAVGVPVFSLDLSLTVRIIILCLTALPLALFALMGIAGEPLSSYIIAFFKWLKNRRVVGKTEPKENAADLKTRGWELSVAYRDEFQLKGKPLNWGARFVLSDNRSWITKFDNPTKNLSQSVSYTHLTLPTIA